MITLLLSFIVSLFVVTTALTFAWHCYLKRNKSPNFLTIFLIVFGAFIFIIENFSIYLYYANPGRI